MTNEFGFNADGQGLKIRLAKMEKATRDLEVMRDQRETELGESRWSADDEWKMYNTLLNNALDKAAKLRFDIKLLRF